MGEAQQALEAGYDRLAASREHDGAARRAVRDRTSGDAQQGSGAVR